MPTLSGIRLIRYRYLRNNTQFGSNRSKKYIFTG
jgi:hypothetical protein